MEQEQIKFLLNEYEALWKSYGLNPSDAFKINKPLNCLSAFVANQSEAPAIEKEPLQLNLNQLQAKVKSCTDCKLHEKRNNTVFGQGNEQANLMFIGEGPGFEEDKQGQPFVGPAGQLLNKIILAMGYQRQEVYIANVVKCRPPENRTPTPEEVDSCSPYLQGQIDQINPSMIVALGLPAALFLTGRTGTMGSLRGKFHKLFWNQNILVMPTYHPAYLLRTPEAKAKVWADMKIVMTKLKS